MSVWAMPAEEDAAVLRGLMARLGTGPRFEPHITLLGNEPVASRDGLRGLAPFAVTLTHASDSAERFRCLVLEAEPNETLGALHADLGGDRATYRPHLSLVYGELDPNERVRLRDAIDVSLPMRITMDAVAFVDTAPDDVEAWRATERVALRD